MNQESRDRLSELQKKIAQNRRKEEMLLAIDDLQKKARKLAQGGQIMEFLSVAREAQDMKSQYKAASVDRQAVEARISELEKERASLGMGNAFTKARILARSLELGKEISNLRSSLPTKR